MPLTGSFGGFAGPFGAVQAVPITYVLTVRNDTQSIQNATAANEGDVISFILTTTGVANGTVLPYTTSGLTASPGDLSSGAVSGNFTVVTTGTYPNGTATVSFNLNNDLVTEGTETFTMSVAEQSNSILIYDTSTSPPVWFANNGSSAGQWRDLAVDAVGNSYVYGSSNGYTNNASIGAAVVQKRYANGGIIWTSSYPANTYTNPSSIAVERSISSTVNTNAIYFCGSHATAYSNYNDRAFVAKSDGSGAIQWQRSITSSSASGVSMNWTNSLSADHTGVAFLDASVATMIKFTTAGATSFQSKITGGGGSVYGRSVVCREGFTYVSGDDFVGANGYQQVVKYSSAGAVTWKRQVGVGNGLYFVADGMDVDADSSVYLAGRGTAGGSGFSTIVKLNSSGTLVWARNIAFSESIKTLQYNKYDGHIYAVSSSGASCWILKMTTAGAQVWQRSLNLGGTNSANEIAFDPAGTYYYISGQRAMLAKLLTDGTGTGTYTGFTYSVASRTINDYTSSTTSVASSATIATSTHTIATPSLSFSSISYPQTLTTF